MNISQVSPSDPISQEALRGLMAACPILTDAEFYTKGGAADSIKASRDGSNATIFRALNNDNSPTAPTPAYATATKKIVSFDAKVDKIIEQRNEDVITELKAQTYLEAYESGFLLQTAFFTGDSGVNANSFDGIKNLVHADLTIAPDESLQLVMGNSDSHRALQALAIEYLMRSFRYIPGGPTHAYMNPFLLARLIFVAKELGFYRSSLDEFGSQIDQIGDVKLKSSGYDADGGDPIMDFEDESIGGHSLTSSIYLVRWGERRDVTCLTSAGVVGEYNGAVGNHYVNNVNLDMTVHRQNKKALARIKGFALTEVGA